jgi:hypothetical protein
MFLLKRTVKTTVSGKPSQTNDVVRDDSSDDCTKACSIRLSEEQMAFLPRPLIKRIPKLYKEKLTPVDLSFGLVREEEYSLSLEESHKKVLSARQFVRPAKASVCFLVKRPGCVICKEQGMMLQQLVKGFPEGQVAAWAVVKEINVDDDGLIELYQNHFRFPFFLDRKMKLYKAMGKNLVNPFKFLYKVNKEAKQRIASKGIEGSFIGKGEGLILGGVLVFDAQGTIQYAYQEKSGAEELPIDEFRLVLNDIIANDVCIKKKKKTPKKDTANCL